MAPDRNAVRKRVVTACERCRRRKRRCDAKKPQCDLCRMANAECRYADLATRQQDDLAVSSLVDQRLERLEHLVHASWNASSDITANPLVSSPSFVSARPAGLNVTVNEAVSPAYRSAATTISGNERSSITCYSDERERVMTIPYGHLTTSDNLLNFPKIIELLGQHPKELFLKIETGREVPERLSLDLNSLNHRHDVVVDRSVADALVDVYFALVNTIHPILDEDDFRVFFDANVNQEMDNPIAHALCLVVLALGEVVSQQPTVGAAPWMPGIEYFASAMKIIVNHSLNTFDPDLILSQSLYLASLYYSHLARPLLAWKFVHLASTNAQRVWIQYNQNSHDTAFESRSERTIRLLWAIFILECDIVAEYHLPRSGIEHFVEQLPFPNCGEPPQEHRMLWLAEISARRLLNRVHHAMYQQLNSNTSTHDDALNGNLNSERSGESVGSSSIVSDELRRQLDTWRDYLPESIRHNLLNKELSVIESVLALRYHASGDIISRPFVLYVCALPNGTQPTQHVLSKCQLCIHHCSKYLEVFDKRIVTPCSSTEIVLHSALAAMIILTLASLSPVLQPFVEDLDNLQDKAVAQMERWAFPHSSVECMLSIVQMLNLKRRTLLRSK